MEIKPQKVIKTNLTRVSCNGGGGALGHPKIYLEMGNKDEIECPYCGKIFKKSAPLKK